MTKSDTLAAIASVRALLDEVSNRGMIDSARAKQAGWALRELEGMVATDSLSRDESTPITRDKLMAALARVQTAIEQGKVLSADAHAAMCECGSDCWEHSCIVSAFLLALDRTCLYDKFPAVLRMEELFDEMGLPALADRAWRIATLNEQGRLEEAFNELKAAVEAC
jgi:hypothetical protein